MPEVLQAPNIQWLNAIKTEAIDKSERSELTDASRVGEATNWLLPLSLEKAPEFEGLKTANRPE